MNSIMKKLLSALFVAMIAITPAVTISGCEKKSDTEKAMEDMGDAAEDAADDAADKMDEMTN